MAQYCFAHWRLSSSSVTLSAGGPGAWAVDRRRACGQSGGRHGMACQYGYVPLGRHFVVIVSESVSSDYLVWIVIIEMTCYVSSVHSVIGMCGGTVLNITVGHLRCR